MQAGSKAYLVGSDVLGTGQENSGRDNIHRRGAVATEIMVVITIFDVWGDSDHSAAGFKTVRS